MENNAHIEKNANELISTLLKWGVWFSVLVVLTGVVLGTVRGDLAIHIPEHPSAENAFSVFFKELTDGKTGAIIELGIIIMLFTPVLRVIFAAIAFWKEKDWLYTLLSLLVLLIIFLSFLLGMKH